MSGEAARRAASAACGKAAKAARPWTPMQKVYRKMLEVAVQLDERSVNPARRALLRGMPSVVWSEELQRKIGIQSDDSYYSLFSTFNQGELFKPMGQSAVAHVQSAWREPGGRMETGFEALRGLRLILAAAQKLPKCNARQVRRGLRLAKIPKTVASSRRGRLIVGHPLASVLDPEQHRGMLLVLPASEAKRPSKKKAGKLVDASDATADAPEADAAAAPPAADAEPGVRGLMIHRSTGRTLKQIVSAAWGELTFGPQLMKQKVWWGGRDSYGLTVIHTWSDVPGCKKILPGLFFSDLHDHFLYNDYEAVKYLRAKVEALPPGQAPPLRFVVNNTRWKASEFEASLLNNYWLPLEEDRAKAGAAPAKKKGRQPKRPPLTIPSLCFDKAAGRNADHNGPWRLALRSAGTEAAILTAIPELSTSFGDSYKQVYEAYRKQLQATVRTIIEREKRTA
eukprot:TRINITY_DN2293_c0_g5_i1.p2 TRINITY_DN2293_c0_g5~~TRINITY_DN2293_c0_g5_i1.p2  ORF type:complete len:453 (+),score=189.50 TRINITY_DN2293_c0_g5_i1:43-1401(+)